MSRTTPEFYERKTSTIIRNLESVWNGLLHSRLVLAGDLSPESLKEFEDTMNSGIYSSDDYQLVGNFTRNLCRPNKKEFIDFIRKVKMQYLALLTNGSMIPRLIWFNDENYSKPRPLYEVLSVDYDHQTAKFIVRKTASSFKERSYEERNYKERNNTEQSAESFSEVASAQKSPQKSEQTDENEMHSRESRVREHNSGNRNKNTSLHGGNEFRNTINSHKESYFHGNQREQRVNRDNRDNRDTRDHRDSRVNRDHRDQREHRDQKQHSDDQGYVIVGKNNKPLHTQRRYERQHNKFDNSNNVNNTNNTLDNKRYKYNKNANKQQDEYFNQNKTYVKNKNMDEKPDFKRQNVALSSKIEPISNESAATIIKELSSGAEAQDPDKPKSDQKNRETSVLGCEKPQSEKPQSEKQMSPEKKNIASPLGNWADYE